MISTLININSKHAVANNKYVFKFNKPIQFTENDTLSIENLTMYNSMFNITARKQTNTFKFIWNADTITEYNVIMEDQYLDVVGLEAYMKRKCIELDLYLIDAQGNALVYMAINTISNLYDIEFVSNPLPTESERISMALSYPPNATWRCSNESRNMQLTVNNSFGEIFGFTAGTYPKLSSSIISSSRSVITPQVIKSNTLLIGCNIIHNEMSDFSNILTGIAINSSFGGVINYIGASGSASNCFRTQVSEIEFTFYDHFFDELNMIDRNINIIVNIRKSKTI